jgi:hypothetical protein
MKKETASKKAWTKPEVQDLDIERTAGGTPPAGTEDIINGVLTGS